MGQRQNNFSVCGIAFPFWDWDMGDGIEGKSFDGSCHPWMSAGGEEYGEYGHVFAGGRLFG